MPPPEALFEQARHAHRSGDLAHAIKLYQAGLKGRPRFAPALYLYGLALRQSGRPAAAAQQLRKAAEVDPRELSVLHALVQVEVQLGRYDAAIKVWKDAIHAAPRRADLHLALAATWVELRRTEDAIRDLDVARAALPDDVGVLTTTARLQERLGHSGPASQSAAQILRLSPGNADATTILARLARRDGRRSEEELLLRTVIQSGPQSTAAGLALLDLGANLEHQGRCDEAFSCFVSGKQTLRDLLPEQDRDPRPLLNLIQACRDFAKASEPLTWQAPLDGQPSRPPVFVVGFPRSGTTLLEQILGSHPSFCTSDEMPLVESVRETLNESFVPYTAYPQWVAKVSRKQAERSAASYLERVAWLTGPSGAGKRMLDKQPLNLIALSLIRRIFPSAPIIMLIRDPRDTVLSCFCQPMKNIAAFYDQSQTASLFVALMGFWSQIREVLGGPVLEVRYEELVSDTPAQARRLLEFVGEPWDDRVLRHSERAHSRFVGTPSYQDVTQPIYSTSLARWRKFATQLEPAIAILEQCTQDLGYS